MTVLLGQLLDGAGDPIPGKPVTVHAEAGRNEPFRRVKVAHAVSDAEGNLAWVLPPQLSTASPSQRYVVSGLETGRLVLIEVPRNATTVTVAGTRVGTLSSSTPYPFPDPTPDPDEDVVFTAELEAALGTLDSRYVRTPQAVPPALHAPMAHRASGLYYPATNGNYNFPARETTLGGEFDWFHRFITLDSSAAAHTQFASAAADGKKIYLSWGPYKTVGTSYATLLAGGYNAKIDEWLDYLATLDTEIVIRWAWEFNGTFTRSHPAYVGTDKAVCADAAQWIAGWRYLVNRVRARTDLAQKVRFFWCANGNDVGAIPLEDFWPGADYVDIVGYDSYNSLNGVYMTPEQTLRGKTNSAQADCYDRVTALHPTAEVWVGETGCVDPGDPLDTGPTVSTGHPKGQWYRDLFELAGLPRLTTICWFDSTGTRNWVIDSSTESLAGFKDGYASRRTPQASAQALLQGMKAVNYDALLCTNTGTVFTAGVIYLAKIVLAKPDWINGIAYTVGVAGATLTAGQNFVALIDSSGTRVGVSADQSANFAAASLGTGKVAALTAPVFCPAGVYYVAFLANGTTPPAIGRAATGSPFQLNASRFLSILTGQTTVPPSLTLASAAPAALPLWVGLT